MAPRTQAGDRENPPISFLSGSRFRLSAAVAAFVVAGAAIGGLLGTWTDEEYTLATTAHGVAYAVRHAVAYELQAPLYFAVLAVWRAADSSVWFARLFSVVCGAGSLAALAAIGRRIAPRVDPLAFALLAGLNPYAVWAAFEIRHYGLALLLSALLWLACDAGFASGARRDARLAFVALAIAGIYVQYFIAFALVGFGATLLVLGKGRTFAAYAGYASLVGVAVAPLAFVASGQGDWFATEAPPLAQILHRTLVHPWLDFVLPYDFQWDAYPFVRRIYLVAAVGLAAFVVFCRPAMTRRTVSLVAAAAAIELVYVVLAAVLRIEISDRYFIALYVPVAAAAYAVWQALGEGRYPAGRLAFAASAALTVAVLLSQYRNFAQRGDWKRVAAYLETHAHTSDVIAVYQPDAVPAFLRQYRGDVPVVAYPRPLSDRRYTVAAVSVRSLAEARAAFASLGPHRRLWFVEDGQCNVREPQFGCEYVERVIGSDFVVRSTRGFYGSRVYELSTPPEAQRRRNVVVAR